MPCALPVSPGPSEGDMYRRPPPRTVRDCLVCVAATLLTPPPLCTLPRKPTPTLRPRPTTTWPPSSRASRATPCPCPSPCRLTPERARPTASAGRLRAWSWGQAGAGARLVAGWGGGAELQYVQVGISRYGGAAASVVYLGRGLDALGTGVELQHGNTTGAQMCVHPPILPARFFLPRATDVMLAVSYACIKGWRCESWLCGTGVSQDHVLVGADGTAAYSCASAAVASRHPCVVQRQGP